MTNAERVISYLGFSPNKLAVESSLLDVGLVGTDAFDINDAVVVLNAKRATIRLINILFTTPDTTNENGYAIRYDRASLLNLQRRLRLEIGEKDLLDPVITSKSVW